METGEKESHRKTYVYKKTFFCTKPLHPLEYLNSNNNNDEQQQQQQKQQQ